MPSLDALRYGRRFAATLAAPLRLPLLRAGLELGLFDVLRTPHAPEALASRQGLAPDLVAGFLRAAHAHGLLVEREGRYAIGGFVRWLLDAPEAAALHAMLDQVELSYGPVLARLGELLKGAERPLYEGREASRRAALASRAVEAQALAALARVPGARGAKRVLDVGCGQATYLAELLRRRRDAQGLGVELDPDVAEEARRVLREAEVWRRGEVRVGDFMTLDLPAGSFDLALLNNDLHYFAPAERVALFRRVLERLRPGGTLAVQTPVLRTGVLSRALGGAALVASFDLVLRAHRNLHGLPAPAEVEEALREAGFAERGRTDILPDGSAAYVWGQAPR